MSRSPIGTPNEPGPDEHSPGSRSEMPLWTRVRAFIARVAGLVLIWWLLTGGDPRSWLVGLPSLLLALWASVVLMPLAQNRVSLLALPGFVLFFVIQSLKGSLQVATMILRPRLGIRPALITLPLTLPTETARALLVNTVTLMPGTLSVDLKDHWLQLHVLDDRLPMENMLRRAEQQVARLLRLELP